MGSNSQYGEDLVLKKLINKQFGYYVDVGCNHPINFNNTFFLYKSGFTGINIDPNPHLINKCKDKRPRDINLNAAVSSSESFLEFFELEPHTLSTLNKEIAEDAIKQGCKLLKRDKVKSYNLSSILKREVPKLDSNRFLLLSIDVEGHEVQVLKSNDWEKYSPAFIIIEVNRNQKEIISFLNDKNYDIVFHNQTNAIFKLND
jgi:FkbM family methyltransferase